MLRREDVSAANQADDDDDDDGGDENRDDQDAEGSDHDGYDNANDADEEAEADDDDPQDDADPYRFLLEEDNSAPNLVPEESPRNVLAGRIELIELIGQGGMGAVWRGYHLKLERPVAVKLLDETLQLRADGRARFIREAQALAQLQHPGVVAVYDCDELPDGRLYLCMELLEGKTLRELMKRGERLDALAVIDIGRQVCAAVEAGHRRGILHRDLTPANIIRLRDAARTIKVIDWGLCKYLDLFYIRTPPKYGAPPGSRLVTPLGARFGTPEYMAPEMILQKNPGAPSFRTDVYSLGVVLYELLTGHHPFAPGERREPRPIREALPDFEHAALEVALRGALCFDPEQRTETMAALSEALERARLSIKAPPTTSHPAAAPQNAAASSVQVDAAAGSMSATCLAESVVRRAAPPPDTAARTRLGGPGAVLALGGMLVLGAGSGVLGTLALQQRHVADGDVKLLSAQVERETAARQASEARAATCEAALQAARVPSQGSAPEPAAPAAEVERPPEPSPAGETARQVLATTTSRAEATPRARPPRSSPGAPSFAAVMTGLGTKIRGCARDTGVTDKQITVQVRYKAAAIDAVRVLKMSKEHPLSACVDNVVRKASPPPGKNPIEDFVFDMSPDGGGR